MAEEQDITLLDLIASDADAIVQLTGRALESPTCAADLLAGIQSLAERIELSADRLNSRKGGRS